MQIGTIDCPVALQARLHPEQTAVYVQGKRFTYAQLELRIQKATSRLLQLGVQRGQRVAVLSGNSLPYVVTLWALQRVGASAVPLHLRWPVQFWQEILHQTRASMAFVEQDRRASFNIAGVKALSLESVETGEEEGGIAQPQLDLNQEAAVVFTSGSSGTPKGVPLTVGNFYHSALGSNQALPLGPGDCWLASLPFYHVGGLAILYRCVLAGAAVCLGKTPASWKDHTPSFYKAVTHISVVPTHLERWLEVGEGNWLRKFKVILMGGAPARKSLLETILKLRLPVVTTYGMTETASQVTTLTLSEIQAKLETAGRVLPFREIAILDDHGEALPAGKQGEIAVRGEVVFGGYLGEKKRNAKTWFRTGDLGVMDPEGYLNVLGRKDDLIISGGENIQPRIIEDAAKEFAGVKNACVLATSDPHWGQRPVLFIEVESKNKFPLGALRKHLKEHLTGLFMPEQIIPLEEFPRTGIDKINKAQLRAQIKE